MDAPAAPLERCAGIDVGKRLVVVCLMVGQASEAPRLEKRKFGVTTDALEQLRVWLEQEQVTHVVVQRAPARIGNQFSMCWKEASPWCWLTLFM